MARAVNPRSYDGTGRQLKSAATRRRILDAARRSLITHGYRATTVAAVAAAAEVSVDTVYELVGRKPVLLRELIEEAISGVDHAVEATDRDYVKAMRAEPIAAAKLRLYARATTAIHGRMAPLFVALRDAASTEPEAQAVWDDISRRRAANMRLLVDDVRSAGGVRADLTGEIAADTVWALNSAELFVMLTVERGWSPATYETWLADSLCRLLLEPGAGG